MRCSGTHNQVESKECMLSIASGSVEVGVGSMFTICPGNLSQRPEDLPCFHHKYNSLKRSNIVERVAFDRNDVGELAFLD